MRLSDVCFSIASLDPDCFINFDDFSPKCHIIYQYEKNIGKCILSNFNTSFTESIKIINIQTKKHEIMINFLLNLLSSNKFSIEIIETQLNITNIKTDEIVIPDIKYERIPLYYESFEIKQQNLLDVNDEDDGFLLVKSRKQKKNKK